MIKTKQENNILTIRQEAGHYGVALFLFVFSISLLAIILFQYDYNLTLNQNYRIMGQIFPTIVAFSIVVFTFAFAMFFSVSLKLYIFDKNNNRFSYKSKWLFFRMKLKEQHSFEKLKSIRVSPKRKFIRTRHSGRVISYYPVYLKLRSGKELKMFGNEGRSAFRHESDKIPEEEEAAKQIANFLKIPIKIEKLPEVPKSLKLANRILGVGSTFIKN